MISPRLMTSTIEDFTTKKTIWSISASIYKSRIKFIFSTNIKNIKKQNKNPDLFFILTKNTRILFLVLTF